MEKLKPCPFCGGEAKMHFAEFPAEFLGDDDKLPKDARVIREYRKPGAKRWTVEFRRRAYVPQCADSSCIGRSQKLYKSETEAVEAWNRRVD